jgi:hypothetical protein
MLNLDIHEFNKGPIDHIKQMHAQFFLRPLSSEKFHR